MRVTIAGIASMVGDHALAARNLALVNSVPLTLHGQCDVLAARVLEGSRSGASCDDDDLDELISLNERLAGRPGQQEATASIALALEQRGRTDEARAIVGEYISRTRREAWPPRHPLLVPFLKNSA